MGSAPLSDWTHRESRVDRKGESIGEEKNGVLEGGPPRVLPLNFLGCLSQ